jgi:hypothetical protein
VSAPVAAQASAQIAIDLNRTLPKLSFFTRGSAEHKMLADVHALLQFVVHALLSAVR